MSTARDIMHSGAECLGPDDSMLRAAQRMRDLDVGSMPICDANHELIGIITDRDIVIRCCANGMHLADTRASEFAQGSAFWVGPDADLDEVLQTMENHRIRRLPVMSDHQVVGMISEGDLARSLHDERLTHFMETVCAAP